MHAQFTTPNGIVQFEVATSKRSEEDKLVGPPVEMVYEIKDDASMLPIRHTLRLSMVSEGRAYYRLVK